MALVAGELIDDAKGLSYPYVSDESYSPVHLLRQLSALDEEVVTSLAISTPERLSVAGADVPVSLSSNATGYTLADGLAYSSFRWEHPSGVLLPIVIVPEEHVDSPVQHPAAVLRGNVLFPCDPLGMRWDPAWGARYFFGGGGDKILYRYVARPAKLTSLNSTLASPEEARQYFVWSLVLSILLTMPGVPPERLQLVASMMQQYRNLLGLSAVKRTDVSTGNVSTGES